MPAAQPRFAAQRKSTDARGQIIAFETPCEVGCGEVDFSRFPDGPRQIVVVLGLRI